MCVADVQNPYNPPVPRKPPALRNNPPTCYQSCKVVDLLDGTDERWGGPVQREQFLTFRGGHLACLGGIGLGGHCYLFTNRSINMVWIFGMESKTDEPPMSS